MILRYMKNEGWIHRAIWEYDGLFYQITVPPKTNIVSWAIGYGPIHQNGMYEIASITMFTHTDVIQLYNADINAIDPNAFFAEIIL